MISDTASKRILVFAPHPDDDILGCGGTIAYHVEQGQHLKVVYLTSGESGSLEYSKEELAALREREARLATLILGVKQTQFLHWPDGYLEVRPEYLQKLTSLIRIEKPHRVYLPHSQDAVADHIVTHHLVMEAIRRAAGPWFQECSPEPWQVSTVLGYEVWTPIRSPGLSIDISAFMDIKLAALGEHRSQLQGYSYDDAIAGLNRYRAVMYSNCQYCECFQLLRTLSVGD